MLVDSANVVGSRADGWWRDRAAAAARLRDELDRLAAGFSEVVLVVEGAARGIGAGGTRVRVVDARHSADDEIVALLAGIESHCVVVTADRELRGRCEAAGATVHGPRWLLAQLS